MSAVGPFFVTLHAVERYRERIRPGLDYEAALGELVDLSQRAHYVKRLDSGAQMWRTPRPGRFRLLVEEPDNSDALPSLVTILPPFDGWRPQ